MRGDFSRKPFRRNLHDAGLLHQQGRVWLDGDWNENEFHRLDLNEQEAFDVIGPCGIPDDPTTPDDDDFYLVETDSALGNDDFRIHAGRAYVDGLLVVLDHDTTYKTQPDLLDPPKLVTSVGDRRFGAVVYLEVWRRLITYLEDDTVREKALEGPDTVARLKTLGQIKVVPVLTNPDRPLTCANAGDHLPKPGSGTLSTDQPDDADPEDPCRLPDDALFTGRENRLYRVEIHDPGDIDGIQRPGEAISFSTTLAAAANAGDMTLTLSAALSKPQAFALLRTGAASITDDDGNTETLLVTAVDNAKLTLGKPLGSSYALTKHPTVKGGIARFKWSRDNASFGVRVTAVDSTRKALTVASLGRDQVTALRAGDLVEIADDASELGPNRGHLTWLTADPNPDLFTLQLADPIPPEFDIAKLNERHLLIRRWDGVGWAGDSFDDPGMDLGDGVRIKFEGFDLRPGDWWNIKTRRVDGSVEFRDQALPDGIERHHCVLAVLDFTQRDATPQGPVILLAQDAGFPAAALAKFKANLPANQLEFTKAEFDVAAGKAGSAAAALKKFRDELNHHFGERLEPLSDCRPRFPPLTHLPEGGTGHGPYLVLRLLGGDGQEGTPGEVLNCPMIAGVEDEHGRPVQGISVRFDIVSGGGTVASSLAGPFAPSIDLSTGPSGQPMFGMTRAFLRLGDDQGCHMVGARMVKPGPPQGEALQVFFEAHIAQRDEPPKTDFPKIVEMSWRNDDSMPLNRFNDGLAVQFSTAMLEATGSPDTFIVTVEIPDAIPGVEGNARWLGHRPFIVYGGVRTEPEVWIFRPCPELDPKVLNQWLQDEAALLESTRECVQKFTGKDVDLDNPQIRVRVTLKSDVILSKEQQLPLDGDAHGKVDPNAQPPVTDLVLPSGDGVGGGDFESWFYLDRKSLG